MLLLGQKLYLYMPLFSHQYPPPPPPPPTAIRGPLNVQQIALIVLGEQDKYGVSKAIILSADSWKGLRDGKYIISVL